MFSSDTSLMANTRLSPAGRGLSVLNYQTKTKRGLYAHVYASPSTRSRTSHALSRSWAAGSPPGYRVAPFSTSRGHVLEKWPVLPPQRHVLARMKVATQHIKARAEATFASGRTDMKMASPLSRLPMQLAMQRPAPMASLPSQACAAAALCGRRCAVSSAPGARGCVGATALRQGPRGSARRRGVVSVSAAGGLIFPGSADDGVYLPPFPAKIMANSSSPAAQNASSTYSEHKPKTPPPDLPSLLLDSRIIFLGMPVRR